MKRILNTMLFAAALCIPAIGPSLKADQLVTICHLPPGDPAAKQTLLVGSEAAQAHMTHHQGDSMGACQSGCGNTGCGL